MNAATHQQRIDDLLGRLSETTTRFGARLESAGPRAELAENGWTPAQIAVHVAMVNENLASVIDGSLPGATPPAAGATRVPTSARPGSTPTGTGG